MRSETMEINLSQAIQDALYNKSTESKRLSTPSSLDDYFKKQEMTERAIRELESGGGVSSEVKKYVDVAALKKSLDEAKSLSSEDKTSDAASMIGSAGGSKSGDRFEKSPPPDKNTLSMEEYEKASKKLMLQQLIKQSASEKLELENQVEQSVNLVDSLKSKTIVNSSTTYTPENASALANPLAQNQAKTQGVSFVDEYSQKEVTIPLDEDNLQKLVEKFGSAQEASDYVKGWYYEAAYGVGYLQNDTDGDGVISKEEAKNLKALVSLTGESENSYKSLNEALSDDAARDAFLDEFGYIDSLSAFINHSIRQDVDTSGSLSLSELVGESNAQNVAQAIVGKENLDLFAFHHLILRNNEGSYDYLASLMNGSKESEVASTSSPSQDEDKPLEV